MDKIYVKDRDIVVPGDLLAEGLNYLPSGKAFRENEKIFASTIGLINIKGRVIKVIPLAGKYMPKKDDIVVGRVIGISHHGWQIDINSAYNADLNVGEGVSEYIDLNKTNLSKYFDIGDYMLAGIINISESKFVKLTAKNRPYKKLAGGNIIEVSPTKIPRIIGKQGSMIKMLKEESGCNVAVGQNGWIWIKGIPENEAIVARIIKTIEAESHTTGLTDKIKETLKKEIKRGGK